MNENEKTFFDKWLLMVYLEKNIDYLGTETRPWFARFVMDDTLAITPGTREQVLATIAKSTNLVLVGEIGGVV